MSHDEIMIYDCTRDGRWVYCGSSRSKERTAVYDEETQRWYWYKRKAYEVHKMLTQGASLEEIGGDNDNYFLHICVAHDLSSIKDMCDWLVEDEE